MTYSFEEPMRKMLLHSIVTRQIFCRLTGDVLDVDTCVVVLDADGDPCSVFSPRGFQQMLDTGVDVDKMLSLGYTWDKSTFPKQ
jgi:hypothetical protein